MRRISVAFVCGALIWPASGAFGAENVVAQAVQRLRLSPQQLLSLRDFLGPFNRGTEVESSNGGFFVLRDATTMAYVGEFSLRVSSNGRLDVDRIGGPARLDTLHSVALPLRLTDKARVQAMATLANSDVTEPGSPVTPEKMEHVEPVPALPSLSLAAANLTDAAALGGLSQSRAEFWPDGSGWSASVRFQGGAPRMRMTERFFAPIRADATQVWRDNVVEIDGDVKLGFAEFEAHYACAAGAVCNLRSIAAESGLHVIRWRKTLISAVPPTFVAKIAAPVIAAPVPAATEQGEVESPAAAPPAPSGDSVPENPNGL